MATPSDQTIDIPEGLDICHSPEDLQTFLNLVNLNFQIITKIAQDVQAITVELPGVPSVVIPGWQGYTLPDGANTPSHIPLKQPFLESAWTGATFPWSEPGTDQWRQGRLGGLPGFTIPGVPDFVVPGLDPLTMTMQMVNTNFELLIRQIPSITEVPLLTPSALTNPCSYPGGSTQAIKDINEAMRRAQQGAGHPPGCPSLATYADYTNTSAWFDPVPGVDADPPSFGTLIITPTQYLLSGEAQSVPGVFQGGFVHSRYELTIPRAAFGSCTSLNVAVTLFGQIQTEPVDDGALIVSLHHPLGYDNITMYDIGVQTLAVNRNFVVGSSDFLMQLDIQISVGPTPIDQTAHTCTANGRAFAMTLTLSP